MNIRLRMFLLVILLATLPALAASFLSKQLITSSFETSLGGEIDDALEAGLRRAQAQLSAERYRLREELLAWCAPVDEQLSRGIPVDSVELREAFPWTASVEDRVEILGRGKPVLLQTGRLLPDSSTSTVLDAGRSERAPGRVDLSAGIMETVVAPPARIVVKQDLKDGRRAVVQRPVDPGWKDDAKAIATGLQLARALQVERERIGREFWMPFIAVYGLSLLIGLIAAWWLAQGFARPLGRLVRATQRVGAGDWDTQVEARGGGEVEDLAHSFNRMVTTLDAQSRRLVDLETMAGWREMARALAHEVKNPLTPIQLTVEEMRAQYRGDDEEYRALLEECTRIVVEEVESLRNVVGRFREFSRPVELRPEPLNLNALLRDLGALQKDLQVELELDLKLDELLVPADADRLRQLLINLAENARQAQSDQETSKLWLSSRIEGGFVILGVEDAGPGISEDQRVRVFDPYHSAKVGGLGLGLSLVKGIALAHGGHIELSDGRTGGAAFHVYLPLRKSDKLRSDAATSEVSREEGRGE